MNVLIELPTWLGDSIMATPAIENLGKYYDDSKITLIGSFLAIEAIRNNPKVKGLYIIENTYSSIFKTIKNLDEFDIFFSFRSSFRSTVMKFFINAKYKYQFNRKKYNDGHQVEKYNKFINVSLNIESIPGDLLLHNIKVRKPLKNKTLGINPGASYGGAKQWYPEGFANVAIGLSHEYDIVIFGGVSDKDMAQEIERILIERGVKNYQNLSTKTSISELISSISNLDLFITGDTGPMHIAAAFKIPTVTIFGPTRDDETSQWKNKKSIIVKKNLKCQPCMKRVCPLKHHDCMRLINSEEVLSAVDSLDLKTATKILIN
jgi:heptosyltransferase II